MNTYARKATLVAAAVAGLCGSHALAAPIGPNLVPGKEFATLPDVDAAGVLTPTQTLLWGAPANGVNYVFAGHGNAANSDVDAMANHADALFNSVVNNKVPLLVNVNNELAIRYVETNGASGIWAIPPTPVIAGFDETPGTDALEIWGPEGIPDADRYSLRGDMLTDATGARVSIWNQGGTAFVYTSSIAAAIGLPTQYFSQLDLDALMVSEGYNDGIYDLIGATRPGTGTDATFVPPRVGPIMPGEYILFSIAPIDGVFDGGEIWTWDGNPANAAKFLKHGGYTWDTANDVSKILGVRGEDITVLEADVVPEPETYAMMLIGLIGIGAAASRQRRKT